VHEQEAEQEIKVRSAEAEEAQQAVHETRQALETTQEQLNTTQQELEAR
jgi:hypothetical protein